MFCNRRRVAQGGYAMAALLVGMSVMAIVMSVALPVWRTSAQRDREAELIFRGEQYARAVALFQRKNAGAFPPTLDILLNGRFLRTKYKDPITGGDFTLVYAGQALPGAPGQPGQQGGRAGTTLQGLTGQLGQAGGTGAPGIGAQAGQQGRGGAPGAPGAQGAGIMGVSSASTAQSIRLYNGRGRYNEWLFVSTAATTQAGAPTGAQTPGARGRGGRPGAPNADPAGRGGPPRGGQPPGFPGFPGAGRGEAPPGRGFPQPFGLPPFGQPQPGRGGRGQ
jgi:type II secretory pathway pseudopilin PulG